MLKLGLIQTVYHIKILPYCCCKVTKKLWRKELKEEDVGKEHKNSVYYSVLLRME